MTFADLLSNSQISAIRNVSNALTPAEQYAPSLSKVHDYIYAFASDNNCVLNANFWKNLQTYYVTERNVMVCIKNKKASVLCVQKTPIFAHHLGEMLKQGYAILWVECSVADIVDWVNWKFVYNCLVQKRDNWNYDKQISKREVAYIKKENKREKMFYEASISDRYKKLGKRGYNLSFDELRALRKQQEIEKEIYKTISKAKQIFEIL